MKLLYLDKKKDCVGCRLCELACSFAHGKVFNPELSRVVVFKNEAEGVDRPQICYHCTNHPCEKACPINAFEIRLMDGKEIVIINQEKCTGCGLCIKACPFNAIHLSPTGIALKCDLCGGEPECVKHCPTGIIRYGDKSKDLNIKEIVDREKLT